MNWHESFIRKKRGAGNEDNNDGGGGGGIAAGRVAGRAKNQNNETGPLFQCCLLEGPSLVPLSTPCVETEIVQYISSPQR